jgi:hypothetical protein
MAILILENLSKKCQCLVIEFLGTKVFFKITRIRSVAIPNYQETVGIILQVFSGIKNWPGNTKGGSITVPLTSCLTGLALSVLQIKTKIVSCHWVWVKQRT